MKTRIKQRLLALLYAAGSVIPVFAQEGAPLFRVPNDQKQLFIESAKTRTQTGARFFDCARIFYGKPEFLRTPLDPSYYSILQRYQSSMTPDLSNTLAVKNGWSGVACQSIWGYCMAYSAITRDLNLLLHFDPTKEKSNWTPLEWEQKIHETWISKKPITITGYHHLHEWSSQKEVLAVLSKMIPWVWGDLASIPEIALKTSFEARSPMKLEEAQTVITELHQLRGKGYLPLVYLGARRDGEFDLSGFSLHPQEAMMNNISLVDHPKFKDLLNTYLHVVQLLTIETLSNGSWKLTFIDPNIRAPKNVSTLIVDFNRPKPLHYQSDSITIDLDRFGGLPADREHMDEIVSNLVDALIENPKELDRLRPVPVHSPAAN